MQVSPNSRGPVEPRASAGPGAFRLSLVLPAYNEEDTIRQAVREAETALSAVAADHEIIVVDDGSSDRTADIVRAEAAANPRVRLVQHPGNLGYGAALRTGFQSAALELVAFTDADCQFDLGELAYMLPLTRQYDITCGYRIDRQDPASRRFLSWGYNTLAGLLLGTRVHDVDCALKIFRRDQLPLVLPECDNFFVNTEVLTRARLRGLSVVEVGVHHRPRAAGQSKVSLRDIPRTLGTLLPFWWSRLLFPAPAAGAARRDAWFWVGLAVLALVAGLLLFPNLSYPLVEPDEGRYAEIAREMLTSGDWVLPTLNREPNHDKPPLLYWLVAGSFRLLGTNEWAARLVPALAAFGTVLATYLFGRSLVGPRAAFLAALALTGMSGFIQCGRFLILDSLLSLWVGLSLWTGYAAVRGPRFRWGWWLASSVCCALGVLTKGPVALVLLAPPLAAYGWLNRGRVRPAPRSWAVYAAVTFCLAAPWYVAVSARDPAFAGHFVLDHHLARFFGPEYHDSPFWYYVPVLLLGCLPWSLLLFPFTRFLFSRSPALRPLRSEPMGFFLLWAGWCVLFFSLSHGKLAPYVLPAVPALATLLGCYLDQALFQKSLAGVFQQARGALPRQGAVVLSAAWLAVGTGAWLLRLIGPAELAIQAALCAGCVTAVALWGRRLSARAAWLLCCAPAVLITLQVDHQLIPTWSYRRSPLAHSEAVARLVRDGKVPVVCYGEAGGSVPFYLGSSNAILTLNESVPDRQVQQVLRQHPRTLFVIKHKEHLKSFQAALPPGMEAVTVVDAGVARAILVQPAARPPAVPAPQAVRLPTALLTGRAPAPAATGTPFSLLRTDHPGQRPR